MATTGNSCGQAVSEEENLKKMTNQKKELPVAAHVC
jgi:predicted GIY-YIG superfamily endonuclease